MNRQWKLIVPRVVGDDVLIEQCLVHGIKALGVEMKVFSCGDDPNGKNTIHNKYWRGIDFINKGELQDEDIVIFCHNDVNFLDAHFREKVEMIFNEKDIALLGFVGTSQLKDSGCWWDNPPNILRGHIIQGARTKAISDGFHLVKGQIGFYDDVVAIDGLCMITLGKYLLKGGINFDLDTYAGNHFYDLDLCMTYLTKGYKVGIADILVYHKSEGDSNQNENWVGEKDKFINKWKSKGIEFPVTTNSIDEWLKKNNVVVPDFNKQPEIIEIEI